MKQGGIVSAVRKLAEPLAQELGYVIWDIEYVKEGADMFLRITIDSEEGITIDDCEKMHRAIDPILDEADPIQDSYHLEISSPGIERELKEDWQISACVDWNVEAKLYAPLDGVKSFRGILKGIDEENDIIIELPDATQKKLKKTLIASLKTYYEFED